MSAMAGVARKLRFFYNERGLLADRREIIAGLHGQLGWRPELRRLYRGRGWGLKYLVVRTGDSDPAAVVKTASRLIESRLRRSLGELYFPPTERFRRECDILRRLAELGLAPPVILCGETFFARGWLPGAPLDDLPPERLAELLPGVLAGIDRACAAEVYHTDLNAGNVIVSANDEIGFIDCEIPASLDSSADRRRMRSYCHERLLASLARPARDAAATAARQLATAVKRYYASSPDPAVDPERAAGLLRRELPQERFPS